MSSSTSLQARFDELVNLGVDMRRWQRRFFRALPNTPDKAVALQASKAAERAFDNCLANARAPSLDLLGREEQ